MQLPDLAKDEPNKGPKENDDQGNKSKAKGNENDLIPSASSPVKMRRSHGARQKKAAVSEALIEPCHLKIKSQNMTLMRSSNNYGKY